MGWMARVAIKVSSVGGADTIGKVKFLFWQASYQYWLYQIYKKRILL